MNYFKELYNVEIEQIIGWQREAGYCEYKINAYLAEMEDWVNSFHKNYLGGQNQKMCIGAGLAQDNSRFDLPSHLEIVGIQIRIFDPEEQAYGPWQNQDLQYKQMCIDSGYDIREIYALKDQY